MDFSRQLVEGEDEVESKLLCGVPVGRTLRFVIEHPPRQLPNAFCWQSRFKFVQRLLLAFRLVTASLACRLLFVGRSAVEHAYCWK